MTYKFQVKKPLQLKGYGVAVFSIALLSLVGVATASDRPADPGYRIYTNERFGFHLRYPAQAFTAQPESENGDGRTFVTPDGRAKIVTYGASNDDNFTPLSYRKTLMANYGGYDMLDYQPIGKTWFVLSGYRGNMIYYEKVMFSCGNRVINVLAVNYPKEEKTHYDPIIEQLEDDFHPGTACR